jgi:hypothetical protein
MPGGFISGRLFYWAGNGPNMKVLAEESFREKNSTKRKRVYLLRSCPPGPCVALA